MADIVGSKMPDLFPPGGLVFDLLFQQAPPPGSLERALGRLGQFFGAVEADAEIERALPRKPLAQAADRRLLIGQAVEGQLAADYRPFIQLLLGFLNAGAR